MNLRKSFLGFCLSLILMVVLSGCSGQSAPYTLASETLLPDFLAGAPPRVREAYQFAIANPHELEKYPCFCGCGSMGHTSNRDCYITEINDTGDVVSFDNHADGCGICVDITQDVMRLMREGRSSVEIRTYIDSQYSTFGPSTDTPFPTE
jgi:hypothetical protein